MKALHLIIVGRVQGVWFRASAQEAANRLKVTGWIRNMKDGNVEAHVQGDETSVDQMLLWCHHGPSGARVDNVIVNSINPDTDFKSFNIRYY